MDWKKLLGSIPASVDEELRLRHAYLVAENRMLRQQITGRVQLTDSDRKALAELGQQLGKQALEELATVAKPATILAWHRMFAHQPCDRAPSQTSVGRPRIRRESEDLVVRMARENRSWGYDRIVGALTNLGSTMSAQTVGNVLKRHSIPPAPERKKTVTWREFVRIHMAMLSATHCLTSEGWSWCGLVISLLLFVISFGRCKGNAPRRRTYLRQLVMGFIQSWSHKVKVRLQRWTYLGVEMVRLRPIGCDDGV
jgi:hypothetical protein